jgi:succinate dehydrogenase hydrophobic anchor subunit
MLHTINQFLTKVNSLDGFLHWIVQRFTALSMFCSVFAVIFFDDLYFFVVLSFFLVFHISVGIRTLIDDYESTLTDYASENNPKYIEKIQRICIVRFHLFIIKHIYKYLSIAIYFVKRALIIK